MQAGAGTLAELGGLITGTFRGEASATGGCNCSREAGLGALGKDWLCELFDGASANESDDGKEDSGGELHYG